MVMELPNYFINLHQSAPTGKCHHIFRFHYKTPAVIPIGGEGTEDGICRTAHQ
jgi:hypothetical protein